MRRENQSKTVMVFLFCITILLPEGGEGVEQFLELFGDVTIGKVVVLICAGVFLWKCYGKVAGYFKEDILKRNLSEITSRISKSKRLSSYLKRNLSEITSRISKSKRLSSYPRIIRYGENRAWVSKSK